MPITTPEVIIDGAHPRTPLERVYRISRYFGEMLPRRGGLKVDALVYDAERKADDDGHYEFMHEIEDELIAAINANGALGGALVSGPDPGDLILYPTNEDGLPVDESGELVE